MPCANSDNDHYDFCPTLAEQYKYYFDFSGSVLQTLNSTLADRVFGQSTVTQEVYEVAARPVVKAAMEGVNGMASYLQLLSSVTNSLL